MTTTTLIHSGYVHGSDPVLIEQVFEVAGAADRAAAVAAAENALNPDLSALPHVVHKADSYGEGVWQVEIRVQARTV